MDMQAPHGDMHVPYYKATKKQFSLEKVSNEKGIASKKLLSDMKICQGTIWVKYG